MDDGLTIEFLLSLTAAVEKFGMQQAAICCHCCAAITGYDGNIHQIQNSREYDMSNIVAFLHNRAGRREEAAMKTIQLRFLVLLVIGMLFTELAWAHGGYRGYGYPRYGNWHGHSHPSVGIVLGVPLVGAWAYRQPGIYTYPPVVTVPTVPQAYMEKNAREQQANSWWYYCRGAQAYYPYVRECPNGWELVSPQPSDLR